MTRDRDLKIFQIHGEIALLFGDIHKKIKELGDQGVNITRLLIVLSIFAEHMANMAQSEREKFERKEQVEGLLTDLMNNLRREQEGDSEGT